MKGDIAFAGFVLTAAEWAELEPDARAELIAVATRRFEPGLAPADPMGLADNARLAEGSGPLDADEVMELLEHELEVMPEPLPSPLPLPHSLPLPQSLAVPQSLPLPQSLALPQSLPLPLSPPDPDAEPDYFPILDSRLEARLASKMR